MGPCNTCAAVSDDSDPKSSDTVPQGIGDQCYGTGQRCVPLAEETVQTPVCRALSSAAPQHSGITRADRKA